MAPPNLAPNDAAKLRFSSLVVLVVPVHIRDGALRDLGPGICQTSFLFLFCAHVTENQTHDGPLQALLQGLFERAP